MTIACGFRCKDGVLLCADNQITVPAAAKWAEPKIARLVGTEHAIFVAFAGDLDFSAMCIEILSEKLYGADKKGEDFVARLRREVRKIHEEYHGFYEGEAKLEMWLLVAIHTDRTRLYKIRGPSVREIRLFDLIGCGQFLARATAFPFYSPDMSLSEASLMATYTLSQTKQHVDGCGNGSEIVRIYDVGGWNRMEQGEIGAAERRYSEFLESHKAGLLAPQAPTLAVKV